MKERDRQRLSQEGVGLADSFTCGKSRMEYTKLEGSLSPAPGSTQGHPNSNPALQRCFSCLCAEQLPAAHVPTELFRVALYEWKYLKIILSIEVTVLHVLEAAALLLHHGSTIAEDEFCNWTVGEAAQQDVFCPRGWWTWNGLPRAAGLILTCWNSWCVGALLSDIGVGFAWCCVKPGVGLSDPSESFPTWDVLWFYGCGGVEHKLSLLTWKIENAVTISLSFSSTRGVEGSLQSLT